MLFKVDAREVPLLNTLVVHRILILGFTTLWQHQRQSKVRTRNCSAEGKSGRREIISRLNPAVSGNCIGGMLLVLMTGALWIDAVYVFEKHEQ